MLGVLKKIGAVLIYRLPVPLIVILLIMALSVLGTVDFARSKPEVLGLLKGSSIIQQEEDDLVKEVGTLIDLPKNEKPSVATVTDLSKLNNQPFFSKAKIGDKVIIFTNAKKVILYRPSERRIVEVGSVNIDQQQAGTGEVTAGSPSPAPSTLPTPKPTPEPTP